jgi:hypothetical protein
MISADALRKIASASASLRRFAMLISEKGF